MYTSQQWADYFRINLQQQRINWSIAPALTDVERKNIMPSLKAWQLGETSDGAHLLAAAKKYAASIGDDHYCDAVKLFITEEQKHGNNLGRYLDATGEKRIGHDWGDSLFRRIRYFNSSMELWTIAVITVESTAQIFYQSLKDATGCRLLKQICTDILIDEARHIDFQLQRLSILFSGKTMLQKIIAFQLYRVFYFSTILVVWMAHRQAFRAGGNHFARYLRRMNVKFTRTIEKLYAGKWQPASPGKLPRIGHSL